ncbi:hypothetical protein N7535_001707 [Penicillium sp. DV-2018c]|nr:hypothetical protein N7461_005053 [Penicillium sp. DV-2018c]KAJ5583087.1 hypothetical protein N7535_001707 [Penicillium sp. DV-2018c]
MTTPLSKKLQQLKLSEQKRNQSHRQKQNRNDRTTITGDHGILAGAVTKGSTRGDKVRRTEVINGDKKLLIQAHSPDDLESFEREYRVMSTVSRIRSLTSYVPGLVEADPCSGIIVLSRPRLRWFRLLDYMEASKFDFDQMLELKQKLRSDIELLYSHGVGYRVNHEFIYPAQLMTGPFVLHLSGWLDVDFCDDPSQLESAEWKQREAEQLNEIERIFELLGRRYEDMQDARIRGIKGHRVERWNLEDELRGQT